MTPPVLHIKSITTVGNVFSDSPVSTECGLVLPKVTESPWTASGWKSQEFLMKCEKIGWTFLSGRVTTAGSGDVWGCATFPTTEWTVLILLAKLKKCSHYIVWFKNEVIYKHHLSLWLHSNAKSVLVSMPPPTKTLSNCDNRHVVCQKAP